MIVRRTLICDACKEKTVTRTRVGRNGSHHYAFPCPGCGIEIKFAFEVDSTKLTADHRDLINASWTNEEGAAKSIMFDSDLPVPADLQDPMSNWVQQAHNFRSFDGFRNDEARRRQWIDQGWPYWQNLSVHFERKNAELFDTTASLSGDTYTWADRLSRLAHLSERAFNLFTTDKPADRARVDQRLALASSINQALVDRLAADFVSSGRMMNLWKEIKNVRAEFVTVYPALAPLVLVDYWHEKDKDLNPLTVSVKRFDDLKHLFVDSFEPFCRLLVIAVAMETVIFHGKLEIPTKKRNLTIWEFEALENANKRNFVKRYPIADLFLPVMNTSLRNGIGHHTAHYNADRDEVVYYQAKGARSIERTLPYTLFCDLCRQLFSAFELTVKYFQFLHMLTSGSL